MVLCDSSDSKIRFSKHFTKEVFLKGEKTFQKRASGILHDKINLLHNKAYKIWEDK
jgi:hypothetical protein